MEEKFLLPKVPVDKRIIPNDMIRSSLFNISNHNKERTYFKALKLYSFSTTDIIYTGEELRQDDEDVWLQLIYLASEAQSEQITFRPYTFIRDLGWPQRTHYREKLKAALTRMSATTLKIYNYDFQQGIGLSLIRRFEWSENGDNLKQWIVWVEPEVLKLFSQLGRMYSKVHWEQRKKLKPLAKWLHSFYSSHKTPEPINVIKLMKLSGSKTKAVKHFREVLKQALVELIQVGFLEPEYFIDASHKLHIIRKELKYKRLTYADIT